MPAANISSIFAKPYYRDILRTVCFGSANGSKRHANVLAYDLATDAGVALSTQQVAQRLRVLKVLGLVETFRDWVDGYRIGDHYNPTSQGLNIYNSLFPGNVLAYNQLAIWQ
jgi:hypothetical protein